MGAHLNPLQRAVVLVVAVMSAGTDSAFNRLVGMTIHKIASFDVWVRKQYVQPKEKHTGNSFQCCNFTDYMIC